MIGADGSAVIPADLQRVILRCMAKSPEERYADAPSLAEALRHCQAANGWNRDRAAEWWEQQVGVAATV